MNNRALLTESRSQENLNIDKKHLEEVFSQNTSEYYNASSLIKESLKIQEGDGLQKRLQARRRANSLKPKKPKEKNWKIEEKNKKNAENLEKIEKYQTEIEKIMDKYAEDIIWKTGVIREKYRELEKSMIESGENHKHEDQIRKKMQLEIESMCADLQKERKFKIEVLKKRFEDS